MSQRSGFEPGVGLAAIGIDPECTVVDDHHTRIVTLYPQPGAPIVRALVVTRRVGLSVHFEAASDGTLLVRIT